MAKNRSEKASDKNLLPAIFVVLLLIAAGYLLAVFVSGKDERDTKYTEFDKIVVTLRENRNRLEVQKLSGSVITIANTLGGWGKILRGEMKVKQPWSVAYFVDMGDLTLDDYIWDEKTRTLIVRAPLAKPDPPNIDESKQVVVYDGPIITRDMQTRLRAAIANGAKQQVADEAAKPEYMAAASRAARKAIVRNLEAPLSAAGIHNVSIVVRNPTEGVGKSDEHWDVSRSIAEVLAERASR